MKYIMVSIFKKLKIKLEESSTYIQVSSYLVYLIGIDHRRVISEGFALWM